MQILVVHESFEHFVPLCFHYVPVETQSVQPSDPVFTQGPPPLGNPLFANPFPQAGMLLAVGNQAIPVLLPKDREGIVHVEPPRFVHAPQFDVGVPSDSQLTQPPHSLRTQPSITSGIALCGKPSAKAGMLPC